MDIVGHGIDVTDIQSFGRLISDREGDFVVRCFTESERLSVNDTVNSTQHLAGKFAAKEAIAKALGTGFDGTVAPSDIEVLNTAKGEPTINLRGGAAEVAAQLHISRWCVSISHSETVAFASAIALASSLGD
jgi:holo-[acyl-carrier protein] synthase